MVRLVLLRVLESYFRRWYIYPLPIVVMVTVSLVFSFLAKPTYITRAAIYVQKTSLLTSLSLIENTGLAWVTPARATVDEFNELIQTDAFVRSIIKQTDLESSMSQGNETVSRLIQNTRQAIWARPLGNNLFQVGAVHEEGRLSEQMAKGLVEAYIQWKINADREASMSLQAFLENRVRTYQADLEKARQDQQAYLAEHPDPVRGDRPTVEQVQLEQLQAAVDEGNSWLTDTMEKLHSAKLALVHSESKARQTYLVLDAPHAPPEAESPTKKIVINGVIMAVVGLILGTVGAAGTALLDSSFRFPVDVQSSLNLPVLAVVPDVAFDKPRPRGTAREGRVAER